MFKTLRKILLVSVVFSIFAVSAYCAETVPENVPFAEGKQPPAPVVGRAWCLVTNPAVYKKVEEKIEISPATFYFEQVPAEYKEVQEKVMVSPAKKKAVYVPAEWKTETEKVLVQEASERLEVVPAEWEWVEKKVEVKQGYNDVATQPAEYKKVKQTIELAPERTQTIKGKCVKGKDCYAAVKCPGKEITLEKEVLATDIKETKSAVAPVVKTVRVRKQVKPSTTKKVKIPAVYQTISKKVLVKAPSVKYENIPAVYKTVTKLVQIKPASKRKVNLAAKSKTVYKTVLVTPEKKYWKSIPANKCCSVAGLVKKYKSFPCWTPGINE